MTRPDPAVELENAAQAVAKAACDCGTCKPYLVESMRALACLLGFGLVQRTPQSDAHQDVAAPAESSMHLQITGDLPWVVHGWRTFEQYEDVSDELVATYGPVLTKDAAEELAKALEDAGVGAERKYTLMPIYPVRRLRKVEPVADPDPAVVA